ncbi:class F sortase [Micromonospora sp. NPDC050686]|uniref:class F sortase n=1 Tax=Micromonospora sp. NPDC050686 TaxID=3154631 RepID=UPI00340EB0A8
MMGAGMIGASTRGGALPLRPPQPLAQAGPVTTTTGTVPAWPDAGIEQPSAETAAPDPAATTPAAGAAAAPGVALAPDPAGTPDAARTPDAPLPLGAAAPDVPGAGPAGPAPLARSAPTTISIPRIGVQAEIMSLGTNPDGTVQVPPLDDALKAGWYEPGASPGETGNTVIVGHVDSAKIGPAVFFNLGALQPGDTITVARQDGRSVTFTVDQVASVPKTQFPADQVYGPNDQAGLRVVTCGGTFDQAAGSYLNNIVVYATMTS